MSVAQSLQTKEKQSSFERKQGVQYLPQVDSIEEQPITICFFSEEDNQGILTQHWGFVSEDGRCDSSDEIEPSELQLNVYDNPGLVEELTFADRLPREQSPNGVNDTESTLNSARDPQAFLFYTLSPEEIRTYFSGIHTAQSERYALEYVMQQVRSGLSELVAAYSSPRVNLDNPSQLHLEDSSISSCEFIDELHYIPPSGETFPDWLCEAADPEQAEQIPPTYFSVEYLDEHFFSYSEDYQWLDIATTIAVPSHNAIQLMYRKASLPEDAYVDSGNTPYVVSNYRWIHDKEYFFKSMKLGLVFLPSEQTLQELNVSMGVAAAVPALVPLLPAAPSLAPLLPVVPAIVVGAAVAYGAWHLGKFLASSTSATATATGVICTDITGEFVHIYGELCQLVNVVRKVFASAGRAIKSSLSRRFWNRCGPCVSCCLEACTIPNPTSPNPQPLNPEVVPFCLSTCIAGLNPPVYWVPSPLPGEREFIRPSEWRRNKVKNCRTLCKGCGPKKIF